MIVRLLITTLATEKVKTFKYIVSRSKLIECETLHEMKNYLFLGYYFDTLKMKIEKLIINQYWKFLKCLNNRKTVDIQSSWMHNRLPFLVSFFFVVVEKKLSEYSETWWKFKSWMFKKYMHLSLRNLRTNKFFALHNNMTTRCYFETSQSSFFLNHKPVSLTYPEFSA